MLQQELAGLEPGRELLPDGLFDHSRSRETDLGAWFGDVAQNPATEGREGTQQLIQSIRNGTSPAAANALDDLPADGVMTKSNANEFHPEWPG